MEKVVASTIEELRTFANRVVADTKPPNNGGAAVIALSGELGAGKTTFTQALAEALGVMETVTSPTFVVMKRYATTHGTFQTLVHVDLYRIDDVSELTPLRFKEELANPRSLVVVEWPERAPGAIPVSAVPIAFAVGEADSRIITYGG